MYLIEKRYKDDTFNALARQLVSNKLRQEQQKTAYSKNTGEQVGNM